MLYAQRENFKSLLTFLVTTCKDIKKRKSIMQIELFFQLLNRPFLTSSLLTLTGQHVLFIRTYPLYKIISDWGHTFGFFSKVTLLPFYEMTLQYFKVYYFIVVNPKLSIGKIVYGS